MWINHIEFCLHKYYFSWVFVFIKYSYKLGVLLKFGGTWPVPIKWVSYDPWWFILPWVVLWRGKVRTQPFMPSTCRKWVGKKHAPLSPNLLTFVLFINQYIYSCGMLLDLFQDRLLQYPLYIFFSIYILGHLVIKGVPWRPCTVYIVDIFLFWDGQSIYPDQVLFKF